jgi:hypothetical protein
LADLEAKLGETGLQEGGPCPLVFFEGLDELVVPWDVRLVAEIDSVESVLLAGHTPSEAGHLLGMGSCENRGPVSYFAVHYGSLGVTGLDCEVFGILGQNLDEARVPKFISVHKHSTAVVIASELVRKMCRLVESPGCNRDLGSPCTTLTVVLEPLERASTACSREESQLPAAHDFQIRVSDFELAAAAAIIAASTESQIGSSTPDELGDAAIPGAVENTAIAEVGAARENKEGTGGSPRLLEQCRLSDWVHGIVGA